jgi:hypothetical protein
VDSRWSLLYKWRNVKSTAKASPVYENSSRTMKTSLLKYYGTFEVGGTVACLSNVSELNTWQGAATDEGDYWLLVDLEYKDPFVNICPFQSQLGGGFYIVLSASRSSKSRSTVLFRKENF